MEGIIQQSGRLAPVDMVVRKTYWHVPGRNIKMDLNLKN